MDTKHFRTIRIRRFLEELERRDTPTFLAAPSFTGGVGTPLTVATADFNGDGFADVAVGNQLNSANVPSVGIALGNGDGTFTAAPEITDPLLNVPRSIVTADFNGDGIPDFAVGSVSFASPSTGSTLVFLGKGNGTFSGPTLVSPLPTPALGIADFNGDGRLVLVASLDPSTLPQFGFAVFTGVGDGTFNAVVGAGQAVIIDGIRLATGDFDRDGNRDFIAIDAEKNQILSFYGDGKGRFAPAVATPQPRILSNEDIASGDFDGDGNEDLIVGETTGATGATGLYLIRNLGSRQFSANGTPIFTTLPTFPLFFRLATADVDRNGSLDVIAADVNVIAANNSVVRVLTNDGAGNFTSDPNSPYPIPGNTTFTDIVAGDANGAGSPYFVVVRQSNAGLAGDGRVFFNLAPIPVVQAITANPNTAVVPGTPVTFTVTLTFQGKPFPAGTMPTGTVTFTSDGIAIGTATLNNGVATFVETGFAAGNHVVIANYPGDARFNPSNSPLIGVVVLPAVVPPPIIVPPPATYQYVVTGLPTLPGYGADRAASGSFNDDGVPDILLGSGTGQPAQVTLIDGQTRQVILDVSPFGAGFTGGVQIAAGDIDGDGIADVAVAADVGGGPRVRIFLTRGTTLVPTLDFFALDPDFRGGLRVALGDLNGDGRADLVVTGGPGAGPRVATYDGLTLLSGKTPGRLWNDFFALDPASRQGLYVAVGDLNGDQHPEIGVSSDTGGGPRVAIFDGEALSQGTQTVVADFFSGNPNSRGGVRIAIRDVNGDGAIDLVTGDGPGSGSTVRVFAGSEIYAHPTPRSLVETETILGYLGGVYVA